MIKLKYVVVVEYVCAMADVHVLDLLMMNAGGGLCLSYMMLFAIVNRIRYNEPGFNKAVDAWNRRFNVFFFV